jgi:hypothetical protein
MVKAKINANAKATTKAELQAKAMAMTVVDLLSEGASNASKIVSENEPPLTKLSYLSLLRSMTKEESFKE